MKVEIPYGDSALPTESPDYIQAISPPDVPGVPDPIGTIREAMQHPIGTPRLAKAARGKTTHNTGCRVP